MPHSYGSFTGNSLRMTMMAAARTSVVIAVHTKGHFGLTHKYTDTHTGEEKGMNTKIDGGIKQAEMKIAGASIDPLQKKTVKSLNS